VRGLGRHGAITARALPAQRPAVGVDVVVAGPNEVIRRPLGPLGGMIDQEVIEAVEPGPKAGS